MNLEGKDERLPLRTRPIIGFFVRFMAVFVVLTLPFIGLPQVYAPVYCAGATAMFSEFGQSGRVEVHLVDNDDASRDLELVLRNVSDREIPARYLVGTSQKGYLPLAYILSLILATPISWSRRARAIPWAFILVTLYACIRFFVFLLFWFYGDQGLTLYPLGSMASSALDLAYQIVVVSSAGWLLVPLPIWALLCFRKSDWTAFTQVVPRQSNTTTHSD